MLHSICQQISKTQQWHQDWKRSVFIPIPKKGNAKECHCHISGPNSQLILSACLFVQSLSSVWFFASPWTAAWQASLSFSISWSLLKPMSIESVMPCNHLIICHPLLLLPSIFPSIRVFSNESAIYIRWPKYWSFSFSNSPSNEYSGLICMFYASIKVSNT